MLGGAPDGPGVLKNVRHVRSRVIIVKTMVIV